MPVENETYTFSPGPWDSSEQKGCKSHCVVAQVWDSSGESLAVVDPTIDPMVATANARLMAAAPDLLEALIYMRRTMYSNESEESIKADAAIAKAMGKTVAVKQDLENQVSEQEDL